MPTLVDVIKPDILDLLKSEDRTIRELSDSLKRNYYTVRQAVLELRDEGSVKVRGPEGIRNARWALTGMEDPVNLTNTISRIIIEGTSRRTTEFLALRHNPDPKAAQAVTKIPKHVARLCTIAERFAAEDNSATLAMEALRVEVNDDLRSLERAVDTYRQFIRNPSNWDPQKLALWVNDPAYNKEEVEDTYEFFSR